MATKWYFTDTTESGSYTEKSTDAANKTETNAGNLKRMTSAKGAGLVTPSIANSTTSAEKWFFRAFVSPPLLAQTVASGTWTFRAAPIQSNANLAHKMLWYAYVLRAGSNVATITGPVNEATASATSSTSAGREHAVAGVSSFSVNAGDQVVVEMWSSGTSSMTNAYTHQPSYGGASEITDGSTNSDPASNVEFSGTINISNAAQGSISGTCTATASATVYKPVSFIAAGAIASGTTSVAVPVPAGVAAGDLLVIGFANKYPSNAPSTPSGWTLATNAQTSGGSGPNTADSGNVYATVFYKVADGSETGTQTVTVTSGNSSAGRMFLYRRTGSSWGVAAANGSEPTVGGTWSVTLGSDPGITANDLVISVVASNSDRIDFSAPTLTATSATIGSPTERAQNKIADGDDCTLYVNEFLCTAGTSSAAPVYGHTNGSSASDDPCGAVVVFRMRSNATTAHAAAGSISGTATVTGAAKATYKAAASISGTATLAGAARLSLPAQGSIGGTATLTGTAQIFKLVSGSISGTATTTGNATVLYKAAAAVSGTATLAGVAHTVLKAAGAVSGTATLTGVAVVGKFVSGAVSGTATMGGTANVHHPLVASISGTATLSGSTHTTLAASSSVSGSATVTASALVYRSVAGSLSGTATLAAMPSLLLGAMGAASGSATLTGSASVESSSYEPSNAPTTMVAAEYVTCTMDDAPSANSSIGAAASVVATMDEAPAVTTAFAPSTDTQTTAIEVP